MLFYVCLLGEVLRKFTGSSCGRGSLQSYSFEGLLVFFWTEITFSHETASDK